MRRSLFAFATVFLASAASAQSQTTNTNCQYVLGQLQCTSNTYGQPQTSQNSGVDWGAFNRQQQQYWQQQQRNMNQSMSNLGAALAADRDRRRAKRIQTAIEKALAADTDTLLPTPAESPVTLACSSSAGSFTASLYEQNGRADVTSAGVSKSRRATFAPDSVSWNGAVWRVSINRTNLEVVGSALLPEMKGATVSGRCQLAERQF